MAGRWLGRARAFGPDRRRENCPGNGTESFERPANAFSPAAAHIKHFKSLCDLFFLGVSRCVIFFFLRGKSLCDLAYGVQPMGRR